MLIFSPENKHSNSNPINLKLMTIPTPVPQYIYIWWFILCLYFPSYLFHIFFVFWEPPWTRACEDQFAFTRFVMSVLHLFSLVFQRVALMLPSSSWRGVPRLKPDAAATGVNPHPSLNPWCGDSGGGSPLAAWCGSAGMGRPPPTGWCYSGAGLRRGRGRSRSRGRCWCWGGGSRRAGRRRALWCLHQTRT